MKSAGIQLLRSAGSSLRGVGITALSLLYPPHCALCKEETSAGVHLCTACGAGIRKIEPPSCELCSQPFSGAITGSFRCGNCHGRRYHFAAAVAPYRSLGPVREFIHEFKYNRRFELRHQLAAWACAGLTDARLTGEAIDALVPVPLHTARFREREFNQAAVLARLIGKSAGLPVHDCLQRTRYTSAQTTLSRSDRMENLRGAFRVRQNQSVTGRRLLLVDDVFTTGSTVEECSRVLRSAGALSVRVLTVARG